MNKKLTQSIHPIYRDHAAAWEKWRAAYFGGPGYVRQALESHRLENGRDFARRLSRATLLNYLRPICDTYANYLFRPAWSIKVPPALRFLMHDVDRRGTSLLDFFKGLMPLTSATGFSLIGVDEPELPPGEKPDSLAERHSLGLRPYLYFIDPLDLRDWETDADGAFTLALVRESRSRRQVGPAGITAGGGETYRLWTREACVMLDAEGNVLGRHENRAGVVPIVPLMFRDVGDPVIGQGLGQDLEPVQAHMLNVGSLLSEIFFRQTFSQMVAEGSAEEYGENGDIARLGTASIFLYPEGRKPPEYISPDATQARLLMGEIDRSIDEIYRLANLTRGSVKEGAAQSGISKAFDFLDTNQALADVGRNVAQAMKKTLELAGRWADVAENPVTVSPPADYGIVDLDGDVSRLAALVEAGVHPALVETLQQRIAATMFPGDEQLITQIGSQD
jgi:hypothetical protein